MTIFGTDLSTSKVLLAAFFLILVHFSTQIIYRLTYHPLARFPGPKIAGATYLYEYYYDLLYGEGLGGQYYARINELHEEYGPIVRVNPDEVHIKDSSYYPTIYASGSVRRDKHHTIALIGGELHSVFGTQKHELHRVRRAATAPLFSKRSINESQDVIWNQLALLEAKIKTIKGPFDLHKALLALSTDVVASFALGRSLGFQEDPIAAEQWKTTVITLAEMTPIVRKVPWTVSLSLNLPQWVTQALAPKLAKVASLYVDATAEAESYLAQKDFDTDTRNVYEQLRASPLPESDKCLRRYADEALSFLLAGSETTASVMTYTIFHILKDVKVLTRLRQELEEFYNHPTTQPTLAILQGLPYLNAVIRESMRLTGMFMSRSTVLAYEELEYHGWRIPPMTAVSMNSRDVLHDSAIWPEPHKFVPERWICPDGTRNTDLDKYWVPFGRGHRICAGLELALAELFIIIPSLLQRYNLDLHDTDWERDVKLTRDCFIGLPRNGSRGVHVVNRGSANKG